MRWVRDLAAAAGLAGLITGAVYVQRQRREDEAMVHRAEAEVRRMEMEIKYRAATNGADLNGRGWPKTVDAGWFDREEPPVNPLVGEENPWIEVAGTDQADLQHPPVRMAVDDELAGLWYNPYQGLVRARVPVMVSDEEAARLYNRINGSALPTIFWQEPESSVIAKGSPPTPADGIGTTPDGATLVPKDEESPVPTTVVKRAKKIVAR